MCQRNRGDIDFEVERIEGHIFAVKQGKQGDIPKDEHTTKKPDLTLQNMDCIPRFPLKYCGLSELLSLYKK